MNYFKIKILIFLMVAGFVVSAKAQMLNLSEASTDVNAGDSLKSVLTDVSKNSIEEKNLEKNKNDLLRQQKRSKMDLKDGEFFIPAGEILKLNRKTTDGTKRGTAAVFEMNDKREGKVAAKIFLYYDNFHIAQSINGLTTCDVRFIILSTLDSRLISFDAKLIWPEISTVISFANVMPNTPTYYNYTLIGDGCYTMDKMPNIVVNRCRVKGFSSAECANRIVWLSKTK